VKAGLSSATITFEPESGSPELTETRARNGFVGGVFVLLTGNRVGGWQLEFLYQEKGARNLLRVDDELALTYLSVPVLLHVDFWQTKGSTALYVIGGASVDFNIKASYEADGEREDVKDDIQTTDVGLHVGGGLEVGRLTIDARYSWGLLSAFEEGDLDGTFKNRVFAVTAGFSFGR
jgi:opacity protein-like surface antigen